MSALPLLLTAVLLSGCGNRVKGLNVNDNIPDAEPCGSGCEEGFVCVGNTDDPANPFFECVSVHQRFCSPCNEDADCVDQWAPDQGNLCLTFPDGAGSYCATGCLTNADCPENSYCDELESGASVCRPESDECHCSEWAIENQMETECSNTTMQGTCRGIRACTIDGLTDCDARIPAMETCNNIDDNCDGAIDETFPDAGTPCDGPDADLCTDGSIVCTDGAVVCNDTIESIPELCNGLDDDCDGIADNNLPPMRSNLTLGVCEIGRKVCSGTDGWVEPDYNLIEGYEVEETQCDLLDNDCDGEVDEPFGPTGTISYTSLDGTTNLFLGDSCGIGPCAGGTVICDESREGLACSSSENASIELCDQADNNCDGEVDETFDLQGDPENCGSCNNLCSYPNATALCRQGACLMGNCSDDYGNCDADEANGCESNLSDSLAHCGRCNQACSPANATGVCSQGECAIASCNEGFADCNGLVEDGCEVSLLNDAEHCGQCGQACSAANGTATCSAGICTLESCIPPFADCDGVFSSGCETNIATNILNCGQCSRACVNPHGTTTCSAGQCAPSCDPLWGNCDGNTATGCETPLNTATNCTSCGQQCDYANASESCATGTCQLLACEPGFANCDTFSSNGCETEILRNVDHCGGCGNTCTNENGTTSCNQGSCNPICASGWSDCDGNPNNGCETDLTTLTDCGACNATCAFADGSASCETGTCQLTSCSPGYANCDDDDSNGCEVDTQNDPSNCGECSTQCTNEHGGSLCSGGQCSPTCMTNFEDCDGNPQNGCETALTTLSNCGGCNIACDRANASESCDSGTCQLESCDNLYCDNNGIESDGCEYDLDTDPACDPNIAINLGSISGDYSGNVSSQGFGETWFKVLITEDNNLIEGLSLRVTVNPGADTDYDLEIYNDSCSSSALVASSRNGLGSPDSATFSWGDNWGGNDDRWIYIRVLAYNASACTNYSVLVEGDV